MQWTSTISMPKRHQTSSRNWLRHRLLSPYISMGIDDVMLLSLQVDFMTSQLSYFHLGQVTVDDVRPYMENTYTIMEVHKVCVL